MKRTFPQKIEFSHKTKVSQVIKLVCSAFLIDKRDICKKNTRSSVDARQVACVLFRKSGKSLKETADIFGIKTGVVATAQKVVPNKYEGDKFFAQRFDIALSNIKALNAPELTLNEAKKLALKSDYFKEAGKHSGIDFCSIADAGNYFLEGYKYALKKFKLV